MDSQDHEMEPTTSTIVASENESNRRKRRLSQSNDPVQETKRFIPNPENGNDGVSKLLELSDEMLLKILQGCDSASLYALSKYKYTDFHLEIFKFEAKFTFWPIVIKCFVYLFAGRVNIC